VNVPPERQAMVGYGSFARVLDMLEGAIGAREYLVDDRFSAADVYVGSQLGFGMQFGMIDQRPAFARYWAALEARPAKRRAEQLDGAMA
ncbi:glutathione S-transferase domain-containing protein, partial [mine drainage metagenome]